MLLATPLGQAAAHKLERKRLNSSNRPSLRLGAAGSVLVTRERGKNGPLISRLADRSIPAYELPLIHAVPGPDNARLPDLLRSQPFDWVVLTSPEAASVFVDGWTAAGMPEVRIAVVGAGTARILTAHEHAARLGPVFTPTKANAVHLSAELPFTRAEFAGAAASSSSGGDAQPTALYPSSAKAASTLQNGLADRGFRVVRLNTYDTVPVSDVDRRELEAAKECAVVSIASPSALSAWVRLVGLEFAQRKPLACIGSTSGRAALKAGIPQERVFWDEDPGMDGFVRSIELALAA